ARRRRMGRLVPPHALGGRRTARTRRGDRGCRRPYRRARQQPDRRLRAADDRIPRRAAVAAVAARPAARRAAARLGAVRSAGVALLDPAGLGAGAEPADPLLRAAVGERLGHDDALGALHDVVVADGGGGLHGLLDVAGLEPALRLLGVVGPDAGEAVGLELEADRQLVVVALAQLAPRLVHLLHRAEQVLDMVADLVRDHVGLGEVAAGAEALAQHLVEAQVDVHRFVGGAVERPRCGAAHAAGRGGGTGVEHEPWRAVTGAGLREDGRPGVLGAREHDRDELAHLVLDRGPGAAGLLPLHHLAAGARAVDD